MGVEPRAKTEISHAQLKALVLKLGALFDREKVLWRIPQKLCDVAGLADEHAVALAHEQPDALLN